MQALDDRGSINEIPSANHTHEMWVELRNFDAGGAMHFGSIRGDSKRCTNKEERFKHRGGTSGARPNTIPSLPRG